MQHWAVIALAIIADLVLVANAVHHWGDRKNGDVADNLYIYVCVMERPCTAIRCDVSTGCDRRTETVGEAK